MRSATPPIQIAIRARRRDAERLTWADEVAMPLDFDAARAGPGGHARGSRSGGARRPAQTPPLRPRPSATVPLRSRDACRCAAATPRSGPPRSPSRCATRSDRMRPSLGTIMAMDGGPGLRLDRRPLRTLAGRRPGPAAAPPGPRPLRRARDRPLRRHRLPGAPEGPDPGRHRDRRMRKPAWPPLRRLHHRRSGGRPRPGAPGTRAGPGLLLRRLLRDPARTGLRRSLSGLAARSRSSTPPTRPTTPTTARSCRRGSTAFAPPAGSHRAAPATRLPASPGWSGASTPAGVRPRA